MSDTKEDITRATSPNPVLTPRASLPVKFSNPDNPDSERPIALLFTGTLAGQTDQLITNLIKLKIIF